MSTNDEWVTTSLDEWNTLIDEIVFSWVPHLNGDFLLNGRQKVQLINLLCGIPLDQLEEFMEPHLERFDEIATGLDESERTLNLIRRLHKILHGLTADQVDALRKLDGHLEHDPDTRCKGQQMKFVPDANWTNFKDLMEDARAMARGNAE